MKEAVKEPVIVQARVGQPILYFPFVSEFMEPGPRAALVAKVVSDDLVNLAVFDQNGVAHARVNVTFLRPGDRVPTTAYCKPEGGK